MSGREPTTAHPLCTCVQEVLSLESLIGCYTPEWGGLIYKRLVTDEGRKACPVHRGADPGGAA